MLFFINFERFLMIFERFVVIFRGLGGFLEPNGARPRKNTEKGAKKRAVWPPF